MKPFVEHVLGQSITSTHRFKKLRGLQRPGAHMIDPADGLQAIVNGFGTGGGTIELGSATYYGDPANPLNPLVFPYPNVEIQGLMQKSIIGSPVLFASDQLRLADLIVRPIGAPYGVKMYQTGGRVARCELDNVLIGAVDATARDAGQGPQVGLHLDGCILLIAYRCTFANNSQSGVYLSTPTLPQWSTNANKFIGCTSNFNSRYGVEMIGGQQEGNEWWGGNIESNTLGGWYAQSVNNVSIRGCDFETQVAITNFIEINSANPVLVEDCNFNGGGITGRAVLFQGVGGGHTRNLRGTGTITKAWIGFSDTCAKCYDEGSLHTDSTMYVNNGGGR